MSYSQPKVKLFRSGVLPDLLLIAVLIGSVPASNSLAQQGKLKQSGSHSTRATVSPASRALVEEAIGVVCTEAKLDPQASLAIDDMQGRPSLPVHSTEAEAGAARAQRLLPTAKALVVTSLRQLANEYGLKSSRVFGPKLQQAIARVENVRRIRPDMESRDNASVFLSRPHTITFGTIFLAGLRSDEGMISVLSHELTHIADGDTDSLHVLVAAVSAKAAHLTGLDLRGQRGEELTCDLVGAMAARSFVAGSPSYDSIARRLSRSVQHNCVEYDEGDDEHLSPRNTIRAVLTMNPELTRELVSDRQLRP